MLVGPLCRFVCFFVDDGFLLFAAHHTITHHSVFFFPPAKRYAWEFRLLAASFVWNDGDLGIVSLPVRRYVRVCVCSQVGCMACAWLGGSVLPRRAHAADTRIQPLPLSGGELVVVQRSDLLSLKPQREVAPRRENNGQIIPWHRHWIPGSQGTRLREKPSPKPRHGRGFGGPLAKAP